MSTYVDVRGRTSRYGDVRRCTSTKFLKLVLSRLVGAGCCELTKTEKGKLICSWCFGGADGASVILALPKIPNGWTDRPGRAPAFPGPSPPVASAFGDTDGELFDRKKLSINKIFGRNFFRLNFFSVKVFSVEQKFEQNNNSAEIVFGRRDKAWY